VHHQQVPQGEDLEDQVVHLVVVLETEVILVVLLAFLVEPPKLLA